MNLKVMILPLILAFSVTSVALAETGWEEYGLKGKVKEQLVFCYNVKQMFWG